MFSSTQYILLALAVVFYSLAAFSLLKDKKIGIYIGLFFAAICTFSFAALLDDFINIWDERFHFLVAKNMMDNPFKPMLYADPVLNTSYDFWANAHIWLHKQPLFMWQMALSMKLFGASIFAARLPAVIISAMLTIACYRSGLLLANKQTGFIAATLMLTSFYWIELVSGRQQLDQNDIAFVGYVSLSLWAYLEYYFSKKKGWLVLVGIFSGFAILCKWLAGLFVYGIWGLHAILKKQGFKIEMIRLFLTLLITIIIALPWQIFINIKYPEQAAKEQAYNFTHLWEPIEGHGGNWDYYLPYLEEYFSIYSYWMFFTVLALAVLFVAEKKLFAALSLGFIFQLAFFSWAATKMPSFAIIGWLIGLLAISICLNKLGEILLKIPFVRLNHVLVTLLICAILIPLRINFDSFKEIHSTEGEFANYIEAMHHNKKVFEALSFEPDYVLFNVNGYHRIEAMFYLGIPVYNGVPSTEQIEYLYAKNRRIALLRGDGEMPPHMENYPEIMIIDAETKVLE